MSSLRRVVLTLSSFQTYEEIVKSFFEPFNDNYYSKWASLNL